MRNKIFITTPGILICFLILLSPGCKKYLDEKPNKSLAVPKTLADFQALLDNQTIMNAIQSASIGEASADNYYLTYADWSALTSEGDKSLYIWGDEIIYDAFRNSWSALYDRVNNCNVILENIDNINKVNSNSNEWNNVKGSALFFRGKSFFMTAVNWCKAYDTNSAESDLGIPLRLNSNFNELSVRSNLQQTYSQIVEDVKSSIDFLPVFPRHVLRPSKPAAYALLSRIYLSMTNYIQAGLYADSCLQLKNNLIDFNSLTSSLNFPISMFNDEVLFHSSASIGALNNVRARIDSNLYASYAVNDLRKTVFFKNNNNGTYGFKGAYTGSTTQFIGIAVDEVYLTRAECLARNGEINLAMNVLNSLLIKRWKTGTFVPFTANTMEGALNIILEERRKELLMRDHRWLDLKRLNKEPGRMKNIKRVLNGTAYELLPNDPKYALPFPDYVIQMTGMQQNDR